MNGWEKLLEDLAAKSAISFARCMLPVSGHFLTPDGLTLHYLEWAGAGQPIILLHGGALTAHTWDLVCLDLSDAFRCVALDLRGHGMSDWSDGYTIGAWVNDVDALVRHLRLDTFHIVGMSLGGNVAAHYAAADNSRATSLVMVDVGPWVNFDSTASMREFIGRPIIGLSVDRLADEALKVSPTSDRDKLLYRYTHMTRVLADGALAWRHDCRRPHDFPHILTKLDELAILAPQMNCPALIVRSGRSRVLSDEKVERFAHLFRDGSWTIVPEAGHIVQEDKPKALAAAIRTFLSRLSTADRPAGRSKTAG